MDGCSVRRNASEIATLRCQRYQSNLGDLVFICNDEVSFSSGFDNAHLVLLIENVH